MSSVDDRIVNMRFNNSQFTKGVNESKRDLTGLEQTVTNAGKSKGMTQLGGAAEGVRVKFSALQVAGTAALATIAAKATMAAGSLIKSFTLGPITDGFKEYTTNLNSVQTIIANTGKKLPVVTKYLDELNAYSDQTIYNFSEMAKNIGTFTAAGVEIKQATSAIKGISNLAALSGSNSQQAGRAMYQLSQAIAAGKVGLMDWNSVVNAGMGGKVFKNALAQTAVAMGSFGADAVKVGTDVEIMGQSFRNSISAAAGQTSWLTSDILVKTLANLDGRFSTTRMEIEGMNDAKERTEELDKERIKLAKQGIKYSDEEFDKMVKNADAAYEAATQIKTGGQLLGVIKESLGSMWAGAFKAILGDFEQSKALWGAVGDVITGPNGIISNISKNLLGALGDWAELGGRDAILKGFKRSFAGLLAIMGAVRDAFRDVFPPGAANRLEDLSRGFKRFALNLRPSKETVESLRSLFGGVFAILHTGLVIVGGIAKAFGALFGALFDGTSGTRSGIFSLLGSVGEVLKAFDRWITSGGRLENFLTGIGEVVGTALKPILTILSLIIDGFGALISGKGLSGAMDSFGEAKTIFTDFVTNMISALDKLTAPFDGLKSKIADFAIWAAQPFMGFIDALDRARLRVVEGLGLNTVAPTLAGLQSGFDRAKSAVVDFFNNFSLASIPLEDFGSAIGIVVEKVKELVKNVDVSAKLGSVKDSVSGLFDKVSGGASSGASSAAVGVSAGAAATADNATGAYEKLGGAMKVVGDIFVSIASGIGAAFGWLVDQISNIPFPDDALEWASVLNAVIAGGVIKKLFFSSSMFSEIGGAFADVGDSLTETLEKMQGAIKANMIRNIALAVAILVASLVVLSFIPAEKLAKGLGALTTVMGLMGITMKLLMKSLEEIEPDDLIKKGIGMAAIGAAMMMMATAVLILSVAVGALAMMPMDKLKKGLGAVALLIGMLTASIIAMTTNVDAKELASAGAAMLMMAIAIDVLVIAVTALGLLPLDTLKQGLAAVAVGLGIMVAGLILLSGNSAKILAAGAAMVMLAVAMDVLVGAIVVLGMLPVETMRQGMAAVAVGIGIMVAALLLLSGNSVSVLAAGAAMVLMAVALNTLMSVILIMGKAPWAVVEQGLLAMGIALAILVAAGIAAQFIQPGLAALASLIFAIGAAMLMAGAGMFLFGAGLALIATAGVAAIAVMVLAIHAFIALLPTIATQIGAAFVSFIQVIALMAPKIRKAMGTIFKNILGTITDALPEIEKLFNKLIETGINVLVNSADKFGEAGFTIIDNFLKSAADHVPDIIDSAIDLVTNFTEELGSRADELANAGLNLVVDIMNGISDAIENSDKVRDAARHMAHTFVDELRETLAEMIPNIPLPDIQLPKGVQKLWDMATGGSSYRSDGSSAFDSAYKPIAATTENFIKGIAAFEDVFVEQMTLIADAIGGAAALLAGASSGTAFNYATQASKTQKEADTQAAAAAQRSVSVGIQTTMADKKMAKAEKMKGKGGKGTPKAAALKKAKDAQTAAAKAQKTADRMAERAAATQAKADLEAQKARDEVSYNKADTVGKGDIRSQQGQDLAERASTMLAGAQAQATEAARLDKKAKDMGNKNKKEAEKYREEARRLRKEAAADTKAAGLLAAEGIAAQAEAVAQYAKARGEAAKSVLDRMDDIREQQRVADAAEEWQKKYDGAQRFSNNANDITQESLLRDRQKASEDAEAAARDSIAKAYIIADGYDRNLESATEAQLVEVEGALRTIEDQTAIAEKAAQQAAADAAELERIQQERDQGNSSGTTGSGGGSSMMPSRTAVEDAGKAVDRYTESVSQAESAAGAASSAPTFVQNNYSPEALSASTLYRQSRNLLSTAEVKIGAND